jgi:hypothetical protein
MQDLRRKKVVPTYQASELELLVAQFIQTKNPTSMMSMESLSEYEHCPTADRRTSTQTEIVGTHSEDFAPYLGKTAELIVIDEFAEVSPEAWQNVEAGQEANQFLSEQDEFNDLVDSQIRETQQEEAEELLKKILIGE